MQWSWEWIQLNLGLESPWSKDSDPIFSLLRKDGPKSWMLGIFLCLHHILSHWSPCQPPGPLWGASTSPILHLTLVDLLLLPLPSKVVEAASDFHCYLHEIVFTLTVCGCYNSMWLLAGISMERYLAVTFPMQYKLFHWPFYWVISVRVFWTLSFGHCSIVITVE